MAQQQAIPSIPSSATALASRMAWMEGMEAIEPLRAPGTVVHAREGEEIFAEGNTTEVFYKVASGVVRVCKFLSDGRRQIEAFHVAGEIFGFELGAEHTMSAEAVSDCSLVSYRKRGVEMLAQKDETVARQLFHHAMHSLAQAQTHSLLLGRRGACEKVATFLLDWAKHSANDRLIQLAMSRQDIADYLGLTIETVSRTFTQLQGARQIDLTSCRRVVLRNPAALERICE
jgi:CRP/FNR family transcriptional regulator, nitrogen fixation regulation protein